MNRMCDEPEHQIEPELEPNERLLWAGRPRQGVLLRGYDLYVISLGLLSCGFAIFLETAAILGGAPFFLMFWGIPFLLMGLYMVVGRFWIDARQRANTYYGVTNERVIIISGLFRRSVDWLLIDVIKDMSVTVRSDGIGTVTLGRRSPWNLWMIGPESPPIGLHFLELIDNARQVFDTICDAQSEARQSV